MPETAVHIVDPWVWGLLGLLSVPLLVALNAFFVAAEFGLVAVRKTRITELINQGKRGARIVQQAISQLDRYIAATQLGITLASIGLGWAGEPALAFLIEPLFDELPGTWSTVAKHTVASVIAFMLITFMHVVFGELIPKTVALQTPDSVSLWVARPLVWFAEVSRPLILVMNGTGNLILRLFGYAPSSEADMVHSVQELALLIEDTQQAGILDKVQAEVVQKVFRLSTKRVRDCLVPREKVAALELSTPPEKVLEAVHKGAHTRMPVYEKDLDNIIGIVNTKDLFYLFSLKGVVILEDALYPPQFLDPDEDIGTALTLFRKAHRPMAIVRDAEQKVLGLITLEDVLEEIVGDIEDEHDLPPLRRMPRLGAPKTSGNTKADDLKK